jgi:aspartate/methionine/tyrosine aminotransferase
MNPQAEELNAIIRDKNPAVYALLSEKGKEIFFPREGILGQTAEAKGTRINATIGAAIEDDGSPMRLEAIASRISLDPSLVFPYAPSFGRPDIRAKWKQMIMEKNPSLGTQEISLPVVTNALTHGVSLAGYLFLNPGDEVITPDLFWGNYKLILTHAYGASLVPFTLFKNGKFNVKAFKKRLDEGETGKKALILNFPNNPSGYTPTVEEIQAIVAAVKESAEKGNKLVLIIDDAYFGLVYKEGIATESIFAMLSNLHENVLAVKVDGATKEDYVWGLRVGFLTFGIKNGDSALYTALEAKAAGAIRGNISNASNLSQSLLLAAFNDPEYPKQKNAKYELLKNRYLAVTEALKEKKYKDFFTPLPFNSGYFMCIQLADELDSETIRQELIHTYSIGVIRLNNLLRIAFSAVAASNIKPLFEAIYQVCKNHAQKK